MSVSETSKATKTLDLEKFRFKRVLREDPRLKVTYLEGEFEDGYPAVVILEKNPFTVEQSSKFLGVHHGQSEETFRNDVYSGYEIKAKESCNEIKATIIHPASEEHIAKYSEHKDCFQRETPEIFERTVRPMLDKGEFKSVQWVHNILERKAEEESILFEDADKKTGFILCKDMNWSMANTNDLHILAITHDRSLRCLRDLRAEHLPLLRNIQEKTLSFIREKFALLEDEVMMYFHYLPSYYHLHLHVVSVAMENPPGSICARGHILDGVISNLEICGDHYVKATLCYLLPEDHKFAIERRGNSEKPTMEGSGEESPPKKLKKDYE